MKKVDIITKHSSYNFGAMLQAYALQKVVCDIGVDCKIIDLRQPKPKTKWSRKSVSGILNNCAYKLHRKEIELAYSRFENFIEEYVKTERYDSQWDLYKNIPYADVYLAGSDQVWNPLKISEAFFLRFAPKESIRASYAASMGINYLPYASKKILKEYLNEFDYISIRENDGKELVKQLTDKEVNVNVDPTLLLSENSWKEVASPSQIKKPYILCYILYRPKWLNKWLKKVRKATKKDIVLITSDAFRNVYNNKVVRDAGPKEFLGLIQGADFVISSSFHGVALSIANKKPFYAVVNQAMPSRINNLLQLTSLEHRIVDPKKDFAFSEIEYDSVEKILDKERDKSIRYLNSVLSGEKNNSPIKKEVLRKNIGCVGDKCTACTVCKSVCPTGAISFNYNDEGFLYPTIDDGKCVECGLCIKKCHVMTTTKNTKEDCDVYYGWIKDEKVRSQSSSGGIFSALTNKVIENGGLVIGAYFDAKTKKVLHGSSDNIELIKFRRSKYVESEIGDSLLEIETALKNNRQVLFCGTPCQCSGVREKFGNNENLFICDFLCHGVPSAKVFNDMLIGLETKRKSKIKNYQFRTKDFGWSQYGIKVKFENDKQIKTVGRCDWFFRACMLDNLFLRKSCYTCDKAVYHSADLTVGDFWGVANYKPEINDQKGISVILVNTKKGKNTLDQLKKECELFDVEKKFIDYGLNVKTSDKKTKERDAHFKEYLDIGTKKYVKKYYGKKLTLSKLIFSFKKRKFKNKGN